MKEVYIPAFFHEVFGEKQKVIHIVTIFLFGAILSSALFYMYSDWFEALAWWRLVLVFLLVFDVFSGCIANFTESTNQFYANSKIKRIVFISIHVHLLIIAALLQLSLVLVVFVWLYTIVCAFIIQAIQSHQQKFVAGLLLAAGVAWIPMLDMHPFMLIVSLLFMMKVLFSFSVDHYRSRLS
ncbi:hypothetical protein SAMN04487943_103342 [Gracilibacillus orientalis]|uniref:Uncharacterized protein n=1 Tax=Gracilibacillus orientalis TaxID=334253 RepID=A0A1I4K3Z6_9BACI|nr:hypothetical protein [Gracilibacillus orientalis]SFL73504.1 hypothetical protein SAMN04487943_103342 [Gracilibacillus orientalis]